MSGTFFDKSKDSQKRNCATCGSKFWLDNFHFLYTVAKRLGL